MSTRLTCMTHSHRMVARSLFYFVPVDSFPDGRDDAHEALPYGMHSCTPAPSWS